MSFGVVLEATGTASIKGAISRTIAANDLNSGIFVWNVGSGTSVATIDASVATRNGGGFVVQGAGATMRLGRSLATGNSFGVLTIPPGAAASYGNNEIDGNGSDIAGAALPVIPLQ